ncbi:MAG: tripartite tricarboxylate transporter TctB family protein [Hyphomicrobiaceae bacterium]
MPVQGPEPEAHRQNRSLVKSPQDLAAGLFLAVVALIAFFGAVHLRTGTLGGIGPGLLPRSLALITGAFGAFLIVQSLTTASDLGPRWSWRGPFFVLGAVLIFSATIRGATLVFGGFDFSIGGQTITVPVLLTLRIPALGLVVAGPLTVIVAAFADKDSRPLEVLAFAAGMTVFSIGLFKLILRQPIPLAPWYLGY